MKSPILGSDYVARSVSAADNRMVNLFPEIVPEAGKEPAFLSRCPGLSVYVNTLSAGPIRGLLAFGSDSLYIVSGDVLYKYVISTSTLSNVGALSASPTPVVMADNGTQIFIAISGGADSYVYDTGSNTLTTLTPGVANFPGADTVCFIDGFFIVNKPNSQQVWASALYDGTTWDATSFASAEANPDNVVGVIASHGELWILGTNTTEVWYNAGNAGFAFAPIQGAFFEVGCAAVNSIAKTDNTIFWLGRNASGQGIIYKNVGYSAQRISTHAIEWQLQQSTLFVINNAVSYTYQENGHTFYLINVPSLLTTFVYDLSTQSWHERQSFSGGIQNRHLGNCQAFITNPSGIVTALNVVGDYQSGKVYYFDDSGFDDGGAAQTWLRSWRALPTGQNNLTRTAHHSLQLDCDTSNQFTISLRWSDDGGYTWSNYHSIVVGGISTNQRAIWRRLGMTQKLRDRIYEISSNDGVPVFIMGAELIMSNTNA